MTMNLDMLNELSAAINNLYGYVNLEGDNYGEPSINSGPCGPFANAFFHCWNERFDAKVKIVFVMVKNSDECWHILVRLPNGSLFDGGLGVHGEEYYKGKFDLIDMHEYDLAALEKNSGGLNRKYPRYCPNFSIETTTNLVKKYLDEMKQ